MRDFLKDGNFTSIKLSDDIDKKPGEIDPKTGKVISQDSSFIWTSKKVEEVLEKHNDGLIEIKGMANSPFFSADMELRKYNILFEYTPDEIDEIRKCRTDILYFADKYCKLMTDNGIQTISVRDYQKEVLLNLVNERFICFMASRQIGKSTMTSIFITWYLCFHYDKNILMIADVSDTTKEVIDKTWSIYRNLPFFIKPGVVNDAVMQKRFDNGVRIIGRNTSSKAGIGFAIDVLFMDEFAHIDSTFIEKFYKSVYPTVSSKTNSKVIITSTPNGANKFYELYTAALDGTNDYIPLRVDWWQVDGRDEKWKLQEIANLGNVESFNQEYGLQFFSSDALLLTSDNIKKINNLKTQFEHRSLHVFEEEEIDYNEIQWHKNFKVDELKNDKSYYVFTVDPSDGGGNDFSIINIWKLAPLPIKSLIKNKDVFRNEIDCFGLVQVGLFRSNKTDINQFSRVLEILAFKVFNPEQIRIVIEMNHKGDLLVNKLESNGAYWPGLLLYSRHSAEAKVMKPGIKITPGNKNKYCERLNYFITLDKIIPIEVESIKELNAFGKTKNGSYRGQNGHDDLSMSCVFLSAFYESTLFMELASESYDSIKDKEYKKRFENEILNYNIDRDYTNGSMDFNMLREMNNMLNGSNNGKYLPPSMLNSKDSL